jgi:hypothetical protein
MQGRIGFHLLFFCSWVATAATRRSSTHRVKLDQTSEVFLLERDKKVGVEDDSSSFQFNT